MTLRKPAWLLGLSALLVAAPGSAESPPLGGFCNAFPEHQPAIWATVIGQTGPQFIDKVNTDPTLAALLGNPVVHAITNDPASNLANHVTFTYPPLEDPAVNAFRLGNLGINQFGAIHLYEWTACLGVPPPDGQARFLEFHHAGLDQYFYSGNADEIAAIDAGKVGPWKRTGQSFAALTSVGCWSGRTESSVYRFYGTPGKGPNSHFFTRDRAECHAVDKSGQWSLEGIPFYANAVGLDGACIGGGTPLYRAWRPFGESNHRFSTDRGTIDAMRAKGWIDEGMAMCLTATN